MFTTIDMKIILFALYLLATPTLISQVGIGTTTPSNAAILDINAGSNGVYRGLLPPRVTTTGNQLSIAPTPNDVGLIVFVEDTGCLDFWNGTAWESIYCTGGVSDVWINEFHYADGDGDSSEFIEIAGVAGTDISGYYIARYNGNTGLSYESLLPFYGVLPDEENGYGTAFISVDNFQNSIDGFALINAEGRVIQFISYEGAFPGLGGPANSLSSVDIQITQDNTTTSTQSIHLIGAGNTAEAFTWSLSAINSRSPGSKNIGQTFN